MLRKPPSLPSCILAGCLGLLLLVLPAPALRGARAQDKKSGVTLVTTSGRTDNVEEGTGASQRPRIQKAQQLLQEKQFDDAEALCDEILAFFEKQKSDPAATYVCVANREELEHYQKNRPRDEKVIWLDWSFGEALHIKAFIAVERKQWPAALKVLEREIRYRPYCPAGHSERGLVLNRMGKPKQALPAYETALALAEKHASARPSRAIALRGIGFTRIELGDLAGARKAFEQSLVIEPNNRLALEELRYIRKLEEQRKKKS
jgi:tetratricopeptide (TPR) repeat protein